MAKAILSRASSSVSKTGPVPVALYLRMSDDSQVGSPDQQRQALQEATAKGNRRIIREYLDDGISGDATHKRLDFQRMLRDASEKGDFREIWCWDQDRFGRFDSLEAGYWIWPLRNAGVKLHTIAQGEINWDDFAGRMMYGIVQEAKHSFLIDHSRNVSRGMRDAAQKGKILHPCYGYAVVDGQYTPDLKTAPVVVRIFEMYTVQGLSLRGISAILNAENIPSPGGGKWIFTAIVEILTRRKYTGTYTWGERHQGTYHTATATGIVTRIKGQPFERGNGIVLADHHAALVDVATFEAAAAKLADNKVRTSPFSSDSPYLLTGAIWCSECGGRMNGIRNNGTAERRYICSSYAMHGKSRCHHNRVSEEPLVDAILRKLQEELLSPETIEAFKTEARQHLQADRAPVDAGELVRLRKRLAGLDKRIDQGAERILAAPASLAETLYGKLEAIQAERRELQARLTALEAPQTPRGGSLDDELDECVQALWDLRQTFSEAAAADQGALVREAVARIDCSFEHYQTGTLTRSVFVAAEITPKMDPRLTGLYGEVASVPSDAPSPHR